MIDRPPLERRYLVVASDGRHVTIGRAVDPADEELAKAGARLDADGLAGWYVLSEGDYWRVGVEIAWLPLRRITSLPGNWDAAAAASHALRAERSKQGST